MTKLYALDMSDKRMAYACEFLQKMGYAVTNDIESADYIIPPVASKPTDRALAYMRDECFVLANAYLTAESAVSLAISSSDDTLINSSILITGYGRIAKALARMLSVYTHDITICARSDKQRVLASSNGYKAVDMSHLADSSSYDFVFNTIPHPVFNDKELAAMNKECIVFDLASFPGGVDKHSAKARGIRLVEARGLPGKYSPRAAGLIIANTVDKMLKEGRI